MDSLLSYSPQARRTVFNVPATEVFSGAEFKAKVALEALSGDITYFRMRRGFLYLVAVMDWHSRAVLSWRLSNTMDVDFCVAALEEAMNRCGVPEIFNTDQ